LLVDVVFSSSSVNALCRCVVQKGRKQSEIEKEKRGKFMRVKSPFVALIFNKYGYVVTGICFEDSLRLLLQACIE
jgi:protein involved in ribonucleotide reduction